MVNRVLDWLIQLLGGETKKGPGLSEAIPIYETAAEAKEEVHQVWDYLRVLENTQAFHIVGVLGFEEWVDLAEIQRRIKELFGIEYQNTRSLYPYLKTLGDAGLLEFSDVGGKRRWRKKELYIALKRKKKIELDEEWEVAPALIP